VKLRPSVVPAGAFTRRAVLVLAGAACAGRRGAAQAQVPVQPERVEAAYLHKLPGFVEWPAQAFASPASPIVVGVAGAPQVLDELVRIARGRQVIGRAVEVRSVDAVADLPGELHVMFVGAGAARSLEPLVDAARARHALVVTDVAAGLEAGAAIEFVQVDGRLRFEISLAGARKAGLKLSSQLMSVAWKLVEDTP